MSVWRRVRRTVLAVSPMFLVVGLGTAWMAPAGASPTLQRYAPSPARVVTGARHAPVAAQRQMTLGARRGQVAQEARRVPQAPPASARTVRRSAAQLKSEAAKARTVFLDHHRAGATSASPSPTPAPRLAPQSGAVTPQRAAAPAATSASATPTSVDPVWGVPESVEVDGPQGPAFWFTMGDPTAPSGLLGGFGQGLVVPGEPLTATARMNNSIIDCPAASPDCVNHPHQVHVVWTVNCNGVSVDIDQGQVVTAPSAGTLGVPVSLSFAVDGNQCAQGYLIPGVVNYYVIATGYVIDVPGDPSTGGSLNIGEYEGAGIPTAETVGCGCSGGASGVNWPNVYRGDPVNTATGAYGEVATDVSVPGAGTAFTLRRSYASNNTATGPLGAGWTLPWSAALTVASDGSSVTYSAEGGARYLFTKNVNGTYVGDGAEHSKLAVVTGGYTLTSPDQRVLVFNASGQLTGSRDATGQGLTFGYAGGQVSAVTDAAGRVVTLSYTGSLLTTVTLADGRTVKYGYASGALSTVTGVDGAVTSYGYDSGGRLAAITDALGDKLVQNTYDSAGRVVAQADATGATTRFAYTNVGATGETDTTLPDGGIWTDLYLGNVLSATIDPFGGQVNEYHDGELNPTGRRDQLGNLVTADYNGSDNVTSWTDGPSYSYDSAGNITQVVVGSETTKLAYAAPGLPSTITNAAGGVTRFTYNSVHQVTGVGWPAGGTTGYTYDASGDVTSMTDPVGNKTTYTYDASGHRLTMIDPRGNVSGANAAAYTTTYAYDAGGRLKTVTDPLGRVTSYGYDAAGNRTSATDGTGAVTKYAYDAAGRPVTVTDADGHATSYTYDHDGNTTSMTDPDGNKTTYTYDAKDQLVSRTSPRGNVPGATPSAYTTTFGYDAIGNQTSTVDPLGYQTSMVYDTLGRVTSQTDPLGNTTTTTYDSAGNIGTITDPTGSITTYTYDNANRLAGVATPDGQTTYTRNADGNVTKVKSPLGQVTTASYDAADRQLSQTDPRGNVSGATPSAYTTSYGYDPAGNRTTVTDPLGHVTTTTFDADNKPTAVTDPLGNVTATGYDKTGRVVTSTDPLGGATTTAYDPAGLTLSVTDPAGGKTSYSYDAAGQVTASVSPRGNVSGATPATYTTRYGYDADGNQTTVTDPLGHVTTTAFDANSRASSVTDPVGNTRKSTYDGAGDVVQVTYPDGGAVTTQYDADRRKTVSTDQDARTTTFSYDSHGHLGSMTDPRGASTSYSYDIDGRPTKVATPRTYTSGSDSTSYGYDVAGNQNKVTDPLGHITTTAYDANNKPVSVTDPLSRVSKTGYDASGRVSTATDPLGNITTFGYDKAGDLTGRTDANGHATAFGYDPNHRLTSVTDPLGKVVTYGYNADGNRTTTTNARNQTTTDMYDPRDLLTGVAYSDGTAPVSYGYDSAGQQTSVTDATGSRTFTYDAAGRMLTAGQPGGTKYSYAYDAAGQILTRTYPGGQKTTYTYDGNGNVATQNADGNQVSFAYDYANNLTQTTYPATSGLNEYRVYDAASRLKEVYQRKSSTVNDWTVTRDNAGQPTAVAITRGATTQAPQSFGYDTDGRLTNWCVGVAGQTGCPTGSTTTTYAYDPVGNRTSTTTGTTTTTNTYDAADELTKAVTGSATATYGYDSDGNRTSDPAGSYTFNAANQLSAASVGSNNYYALTYDHAGNLATTSNWSCATGTGPTCTTKTAKNTTKLTWDTNADLPQLSGEAVTSGTGAAVSSTAFYQGPQDTPLVTEATTSSTATTYDTHDWTGSVADMFTTAGVDQTAYSYDPFGTATSTAKPTSATQPFGYTGQLTNPVLTGQQDLRARNYDPATAAFTSRDPIQVRPGKPYTSAYSYTDDAPTYRVDPSGKCWWMPGTGDAGCVNGIRDGLNLASQIDPGGPATEIRALLKSCKQGADFGRQHYSKMQYPDAMGCLGEFVGVNSIVQGAQDMSHGCTQRGEQEMGLGLFQLATLAIPAFDGAGATLNGAEDSALASAVSAPGATEKLVDQLVEQEGAAPTINDLRAKLAELMRRRMLGFDQAKNKFVRSEMETALRVESQRGVSLTRSTGTAEDWFDQYGRSYDAIGNFPGEFFDREWENLKDQTVTHLAKAQFVPVDVSQFTPAQTAMVRDFIAQFGSRVFIVSG